MEKQKKHLIRATATAGALGAKSNSNNGRASPHGKTEEAFNKGNNWRPWRKALGLKSNSNSSN